MLLRIGEAHDINCTPETVYDCDTYYLYNTEKSTEERQVKNRYEKRVVSDVNFARMSWYDERKRIGWDRSHRVFYYKNRAIAFRDEITAMSMFIDDYASFTVIVLAFHYKTEEGETGEGKMILDHICGRQEKIGDFECETRFCEEFEFLNMHPEIRYGAGNKNENESKNENKKETRSRIWDDKNENEKTESVEIKENNEKERQLVKQEVTKMLSKTKPSKKAMTNYEWCQLNGIKVESYANGQIY